LGGHWVVEEQGARQWPSTQSLPDGHCSGELHVSEGGRGRHSPVTHISVAPQSLSVLQPWTQVLLMQ
jgi:hypothetical protein